MLLWSICETGKKVYVWDKMHCIKHDDGVAEYVFDFSETPMFISQATDFCLFKHKLTVEEVNYRRALLTIID